MTATDRPVKPLGRKAYGSIGHILSSRLGPGDHHVHEGQSLICTDRAPKGKTVWAQTKLDGSCVAVALIDGQVVPLIRAGYLASSSHYPQHHLFARWVESRATDFRWVLNEGERLVGEWLALAHGTRYDLTGRDPFVPFDLMTGKDRLPVADFNDRVAPRFSVPATMPGPVAPEVAMAVLGAYGAEKPEGVVYRVESAGRVEFLAKWVRPDKVDGSYFDAEVWNWSPTEETEHG